MSLRSLFLVAALFTAACTSSSDPTPAPCAVDSDCGDARCLHVHDDAGGDVGGYCELARGGTSSATPAPCTTNADCGSDIVCAHLHDDATGADLGGFCDVEERIACPAAGCDPGK